jgi:hypothetical protein
VRITSRHVIFCVKGGKICKFTTGDYETLLFDSYKLHFNVMNPFASFPKQSSRKVVRPNNGLGVTDDDDYDDDDDEDDDDANSLR